MQYCGNIGKPANSEVTVVGCLSNCDFVFMTDAREYIPKDWCENPRICEDAGIPEDQRIFKAKAEIACDIVLNNKDLGADFSFVGVDGLYGIDPKLA